MIKVTKIENGVAFSRLPVADFKVYARKLMLLGGHALLRSRNNDEARIQLKLFWICPKCDTQHGMRGDPEREARYINGPLIEGAQCRECSLIVKLKPVRKEV